MMYGYSVGVGGFLDGLGPGGESPLLELSKAKLGNVQNRLLKSASSSSFSSSSTAPLSSSPSLLPPTSFTLSRLQNPTPRSPSTGFSSTHIQILNSSSPVLTDLVLSLPVPSVMIGSVKVRTSGPTTTSMHNDFSFVASQSIHTPSTQLTIHTGFFLFIFNLFLFFFCVCVLLGTPLHRHFTGLNNLRLIGRAPATTLFKVLLFFYIFL
jgi:hypothetical protein